MKKNNLITMTSKMFPALQASSLTYNAEKNVLLTTGYTSAAGNTYYKALRMSDRLAVLYNLGQGYVHTFLNSITLLCWDGTKPKIIAQKFWGGCNWRAFSETFAKEQSIIMLKDFLAGQMKSIDSKVNEQELLNYSRIMIEETRQKRIC